MYFFFFALLCKLYKLLFFICTIIVNAVAHDSSYFIQQINSKIGNVTDTTLNDSIIGKINDLLPVNPIEIATYNKFLIGGNEFHQTIEQHSKSLFTTFWDLKNLFNLFSNNIAATVLNDINDLIGSKNDTELHSTVFGKIKLLSNRFSTNEQIYLIINEIIDGYINNIKYKIFESIGINSEDFDLFYNLSSQTIFEIINNTAEKNELIKNDIKSQIQGNFEGSIENQIKFLSENMKNNINFKNDYLRIGDELTEYSLIYQIKRLVSDIDILSTNNEKIKSVYEHFFYTANSVQSRIYELRTKLLYEYKDISDAVGDILRQDDSVFGHVNLSIKKLEIEDAINEIGNEDDIADANISCISKLRFIINRPDLDNLSKQSLDGVIGNEYFDMRIYKENIINILCFLKETINKNFSVLSKDISNYISTTINHNIKSLIDSIINSQYSDIVRNLGFKTHKNNEESVWGHINTILKNIKENFENITSVKLINQIPSNISIPSELLQSFQIRMISFLNLIINEFYGLPFYNIGFELFDSGYVYKEHPNDGEMFSQNNGLRIRDYGFFELMNNYKDEDISKFIKSEQDQILESINLKIYSIMHQFISQPILEILKHENNESVHSTLTNIRNIISGLSEYFSDEITLIGNSSDKLVTDSLQNHTIFALLNKTIEIISNKKHLISKDNFKKLISEISDIHDTSITKLSRKLFPTTKYLFGLLESNNLQEYKTIVKSTIGTKNDHYESLYRSLFAIMNTILKINLENYSTFEFGIKTDTSSDTLGVGGVLNVLYEKILASHLQSSTDLLENIGQPTETLSIATGFFKQLIECKNMINAGENYNNSENIKIFYTYIENMKTIIKNFDINNSNHNNFVNSLKEIFDILLFKDDCFGCIDHVNFLDKICENINNVIKNLSTISQFNFNKLVSQENASNIYEILLQIEQHFNILQDTVINNNFENCIFLNNDRYNELKDTFDNLFSYIKNMWISNNLAFNEYVFTKKENIGCDSIQERINDLSSLITTMSLFINAPTNLPNSNINTQIFSSTINILNEISNSFSSLYNLNFCNKCDESFETSNIGSSFTNINNSILEIKDFIDNYHYVSLIPYIHNIANNLITTSSFCRYDLNKNQIESLIDNSESETIFKNLSTAIENINNSLQTIDNFVNINQSTYQALNEISNSTTVITNIFEDLYTFLNLFDMEEPEILEFDNYTIDIIPELFDSIKDSLNYVNIFWENFFNSAEQSDIYGNKWIVKTFLKISQNTELISNKLQSISIPTEFQSDLLFNDIKSTILNISTNVKNLYEVIESSCPNRFINSFGELSKKTKLLSLNLNLFPIDDDNVDYSEAVNLFLSELNEDYSVLTELLNYINQLTDIDYCLHVELFNFVIQAINSIDAINLGINNLLTNIGIIPFGIIDVIDDISTLENQIDLVNNSVLSVNSFLEQVIASNVTTPKCNQYLNNALRNFYELFDNLNNVINSIISKVLENGLCIYNQVNVGNLITLPNSFLQTEENIEGIIEMLKTGTNCSSFLISHTKNIHKTFKGIFSNIEILYESELTNEFLNNICNMLALSLQDLTNINTFFENAKNNISCIADLENQIANLEENINIFGYEAQEESLPSVSEYLYGINEFLKNIFSYISSMNENFEYSPTISQFVEKIVISKNLISLIAVKLNEISNNIKASKNNILCSTSLIESANNLINMNKNINKFSIFLSDLINKIMVQERFLENMQNESIAKEFLYNDDGGLVQWFDEVTSLNSEALDELKKLNDAFLDSYLNKNIYKTAKIFL